MSFRFRTKQFAALLGKIEKGLELVQDSRAADAKEAYQGTHTALLYVMARSEATKRIGPVSKRRDGLLASTRNDGDGLCVTKMLRDHWKITLPEPASIASCKICSISSARQLPIPASRPMKRVRKIFSAYSVENARSRGTRQHRLETMVAAQ